MHPEASELRAKLTNVELKSHCTIHGNKAISSVRISINNHCPKGNVFLINELMYTFYNVSINVGPQNVRENNQILMSTNCKKFFFVFFLINDQ